MGERGYYVATNASGTRQPITTTPQVVEANAPGYMVVFGTGKYVEPNDNSNADVQSIYGIWILRKTRCPPSQRHAVRSSSELPRCQERPWC